MIGDILWPGIFVHSDAVFKGPSIHHQQGHNRVIIRGRRQFDLTAGGQFRVHGEDVRHVGFLSIQNVGQISQGVLTILHEQIDQTLISVAGIVIPLNVGGAELIEIPKNLQIKEILSRKQSVIHDGRRLQIVHGHVIQLRVALTGRENPPDPRVFRGDIVNPSGIPKGLELHRVKFEGCGIWIAVRTP